MSTESTKPGDGENADRVESPSPSALPVTDGSLACLQCGAPLRSRMVHGLCPRCVLRAALSEPAPDPDRAVSQQFGGYELIRELGRGGMGIVYEARQVSLNRVVALKMLLPARLASSQELERFQFEAEGVAALDHPNILPVYEVGTTQGQPYFTMKLAEGGSLAQQLGYDEELSLDSILIRRRPPAESVRLVATLARAVHYAHQRGIQHRDLKPGNILLDRDGRPFVSDFGLAKFRDRDSGLTLSTTVLGSPAYMSPEQAAGDSRHVTVASDVYSLGAILYELLVGRAPFHAPTALETMRQVVEQEPPSLRDLNPEIPRDLDVICLKCLRKRPTERYPTAEALSDELERWLAGEPILARPISSPERFARWCRRKPALVASMAALVLALGAGVAGVAVQWRRAETHAANAEEQSRQREMERYAADMQVTSQALAGHDLGLARRMLAAEVPAPGEPDQRGLEWHLLAELSKGDHALTFTGHTATVTCVAVSDDGTRLASGGMDGFVRLWNATNVSQLAAIPHGSVVWSVNFTPDGERIITAGMDGKVRFWTSDGARAEASLAGQNAALSGDGVRLAVSAGSPFKYFGAPPGVTVWDWRARRKLFETNVNARRVTISADGRWVAATGAARNITLWNIETGESRQLNTGDAAWSLAFSPDGQRLAAAGFGVGARLWELNGTNAPTVFVGHQFHVWGIAFSPDGERVVTTGSDRTVRRRSLSAPDQVEVLTGHDDEIWAVALGKSDARIFTASKDMTVRAWNAGRPRDDMKVSSVQFWPMRLSADGQRILTVPRWSPEKSVALVQATDGAVVENFPDRWVATFAANGEDVQLLDERAGQLEKWSARQRSIDDVVRLEGVNHAIRARAFAFSPDGSVIAVVDAQEVNVWRTSDGVRIGRPLKLENGSQPVLALSPQGTHLAVSLEAPYVIWLHDLKSGAVHTLRNHTEAVKGMAFSHDGQVLASAALDRFIRLWNIRDGSLQGELVRYFEEATGVAFSPDDRLLASIGHEQSVNLWHLPTRREVLSLSIPNAGDHIAFSPSGDALVFSTVDNRVRILRTKRSHAPVQARR